MSPDRRAGDLMASNAGDWTVYQKLVLDRLDTNTRALEAITIRLQEFAVEQAVLKVKAGVWGLIGGTVPVAVMIATYAIIHYMGVK